MTRRSYSSRLSGLSSVRGCAGAGPRIGSSRSKDDSMTPSPRVRCGICGLSSCTPVNARPRRLRGLRPLIGEARQEQLEPAVLLFGGEPPAALERNETVQGGPEGLGQQP